jgi:hypothetical protein
MDDGISRRFADRPSSSAAARNGLRFCLVRGLVESMDEARLSSGGLLALALFAGAALFGASHTAAAETRSPNSTPPPLIRVAIGVEQESRLSFPPAFGEHPAARAVAQGVREACLSEASSAPKTPVPACQEVSDLPGSRVCVDETAVTALSREVECQALDVSAEAIDLSRSGCDTAVCFEAVARQGGATHLLMMGVSWQDGLTATGSLVAFETGRVTPLGPGPGYNPERPRTGPQVLGIIKWLARDAVTRELQSSSEARTKAVGVATGPAGSSPPAVGIAGSPSLAVAPEPRPTRSVLGWTLVGAGVVAGVASAWLFAVDRTGTSCSSIAGDLDPCAKERRTIVPAASLGIGALGALIAGGAILVHDHRGDGPRLAAFVHPGGLVLSGRF